MSASTVAEPVAASPEKIEALCAMLILLGYRARPYARGIVIPADDAHSPDRPMPSQLGYGMLHVAQIVGDRDSDDYLYYYPVTEPHPR